MAVAQSRSVVMGMLEVCCSDFMPEADDKVSGLLVSRSIVWRRPEIDGPNNGGFCRLLAA
jgi:hypothetical protein